MKKVTIKPKEYWRALLHMTRSDWWKITKTLLRGLLIDAAFLLLRFFGFVQWFMEFSYQRPLTASEMKSSGPANLWPGQKAFLIGLLTALIFQVIEHVYDTVHLQRKPEKPNAL